MHIIHTSLLFQNQKQRISLKFHLLILWYNVLLPYVTKLPTFTDKRIKIFWVDLFSWALQKIVLHVLIFVESPKMNKIANFYPRKNLVPKVCFLTSIDRKTAHHRHGGSPVSNLWPDKSMRRNLRLLKFGRKF